MSSGSPTLLRKECEDECGSAHEICVFTVTGVRSVAGLVQGPELKMDIGD